MKGVQGLPDALSMAPPFVDSHVPGLWGATKCNSPYTAPGVPPVSSQKPSGTLTQRCQTAKDLMKEKACMPRGRIIFFHMIFWS